MLSFQELCDSKLSGLLFLIIWPSPSQNESRKCGKIRKVGSGFVRHLVRH